MMSIVVQDPAGRLFVFSKGADSAILPLVADKSDPKYAHTHDHVEKYAENGMRTLVFAFKQVRDLVNRAEIEDYDPAFFESNLELLGATGVEDKLQDGVKECIRDF